MQNETTTTETKRRGRPVVENSTRQAKLAARVARVEAGGSISKGRPANPDSKRQARLQAQIARAAAGIVIKPGRPKVVTATTDEPIVEAVA
jgi:hypothetical protein